MRIGSKIKLLRKYNNLSMDDLIQRMKIINPLSGVSKSNISRWENEIDIPSAENIVLISQTLNVSSDFFIRYK